MNDIKAVIDALQLVPHPEGGFYRCSIPRQADIPKVLFSAC